MKVSTNNGTAKGGYTIGQRVVIKGVTYRFEQGPYDRDYLVKIGRNTVTYMYCPKYIDYDGEKWSSAYGGRDRWFSTPEKAFIAVARLP